ncbi:hypothetical protein L0337_31830 [candidate division KSB1 bacterium]|nr:hypothetical protein [candidate division KSB1 bacterium]
MKITKLKRRKITETEREALREHRRRSRAAKKGWKTRRSRKRKARKQHKKFRAKSRSHRPRLQLSFSIVGPRGASKAERIRAVRTRIATGKFPSEWREKRAEWISWRNPDTKHGRSKNWQSGTLAQVLPSLGRVLRPLFGIRRHK